MIDISGWLGVIFCLVAYGLINYNYLSADDWLYQLLNILGAGGLIINALYYHDKPNILVNIAWVLIALSRLLPWKKLTKMIRR